ncbi:hypothetical protein EZV62_013546 [Acer yangbiense]|uniref:SWIM-type domain-containing protein n=1 Tax=Acer yangbiense TaxID=1000413 RepID=A0A5C7HYF7_9ROSI|nr:hypothetical protein EZV62_013546 [Acer yangbiense]
MEDIFEIYVTIDTRVVELGTCDAKHISMIVLLHALSEIETGRHEVPIDEYDVWVYLPWSDEKKVVTSDTEILEVFKSFSEHKETKIMFEIQKMPYIPVAPLASSSDNPNPQPRFMTDLNDVDFSGFEENIFYSDGDNDDVGENKYVGADGLGDQTDVVDVKTDEMGGVPGLRELIVIPEVPEPVCEMPDEIDNDLFEGYQSNSEDEFFSDSDDERDDSKVQIVMKSNSFKQLVGCPIRFEVGQTHDSVYTLRSLLTDYAIHEGFNFKKIKNDKNMLTWACLAENCPWRLHASIVSDDTTMQVKTYNSNHTCHRIYKSQEARAKWISSKFEVLVKNNPRIHCGVISDLLRDQFNVTVDTQRLYKAKRRALEVLLKEHTECFSHIRGYAVMVQQCNPGSAAYIRLQTDTSIFQRLFVCFEAQKMGFLEGCRPFIGIDGCHLKGPYGGVLLSAVALDANSGLYPLAYCICEGETLLSWSWFLRQLRCFLKYPEDRPICFMSDKQKGVIGALKMYWPKASVRFCARHIYANFNKQYSGQKMRKLFWKASKIGDKHEFKKCLQDIGKAFNSMLKDCRSKNYLGLMEYIRRMVMSRFQLRKEECSRWGTVIPLAVNKKIKENSVECRVLRTLHSGQGKYEMLGLNRAYTANLNDKTCECGQWQVSGVPCCHALAGIRHHFGVTSNQNSLQDFIDPALSKAAYLRTYNYMIHPILDLCVWGDHVGAPIQPPPVKRKPGRPKLVRKRESTEKPKAARSGGVVCGKCKIPGHNSRTCKTEGRPVETKASKKQPGVTEDEGASSSLNPSKKRQRASSKHVGDKSSQPTTQVQTQPISQVTQLD